MFAIVEASGRQYELIPGRYIDIDMTAEEEGTTHVFENVLDAGRRKTRRPLVSLIVKGARVDRQSNLQIGSKCCTRSHSVDDQIQQNYRLSHEA